MLTKYKKLFFQNSTKDRTTHFNIHVAVKNHRDDKIKLLIIKTKLGNVTVITGMINLINSNNSKWIEFTFPKDKKYIAKKVVLILA